MKRRLIITALFAAVALAPSSGPSSQAQARLGRAAAPVRLVSVEHVSGPTGGCLSCCPSSCPPVKVRAACVTYRYRGCTDVCCNPCLPKIKQTLVFCHPATGCYVAVPVCLPGCCQGCPKVAARRTLVGCGAVTYCWSCGYQVTIRFQRAGDVAVVYHT